MSHTNNRRRRVTIAHSSPPTIAQARSHNDWHAHLRTFCVHCAEAFTVEVVVLVLIRASWSIGAVSLAALFTR